MAWVPIHCPDGMYEIDVDGVARIIRSYSYARALNDNSSPKTESHFFGPDIESVEIDWDKVGRQRDSLASYIGNDFYMRMSTGLEGKEGLKYLEDLIDERDDATEQVEELQKTAGQKTMDNIEKSVSRGEYAETAFTVIRDACAETELVLATGGAAAFGLEAGAAAGTIAGISISQATASAGAITVGSLMKGGFKWQDTRSFGQGVAEASVELIVNFLTFGLGKQIDQDPDKLMKQSAKLVVALVFGGELKGTLKMVPASYVSPNDVARGKKKTSGQLLIPAAANVPSAVAKMMMDALLNNPKWAIPATVALKLGLKYGAASLATPAKPKPPAVTQAVRERGVLRDLAAMGRNSINCTVSQGFVDCSKPEEDFVTNSALRQAA
jgi:hypothetical protein